MNYERIISYTGVSKIAKAYPPYVHCILPINSVVQTPLSFTSLDFEFLDHLSLWLKRPGVCPCIEIKWHKGGHGGRVVTLSPPTSEARVQFPAWPQERNLVVACRWSAVYSTEP